MWQDYDGPNDVNPLSGAAIEASSPGDAAVKFARGNSSDDECACVVMGPDGKYFEIEAVKIWDVDKYSQVTLAELQDPERTAYP